MSSTLGLAFLAFFAGLVALTVLEGWLLTKAEGIVVSRFVAERVAIPLCRYALLILFLLLAYPALFGLRQAPPLSEVLFATEGRVSDLLNLLYVFGLLLPLIPILDRLPVVALPLHTLVGATLLFYWLSRSLGQNASLFPGWSAALGFGVVLVLGHWLGKRLQRLSSSDAAGAALYGAVLMGCQVPAILTYTLPLGRSMS